MIEYLAKKFGYTEKLTRELTDKHLKEIADIGLGNFRESQRKEEAHLKEIAALGAKHVDEVAKITKELQLRPTPLDIKLFEQFIQRGVTQSDAELMLDVTSIEFEQWRTNKEIDRILKTRPKQDPDKYTIYHPDLEGQTELAFESGLTKYYRFKDDFRMPVGRYKYVYKRFLEHELRMTKPVLEKYLDQMEKTINGGSSGKMVEITTIVKIIYAMRTWLKMPFEPGAVKRLAAVVYFTDQEDLSTFDEAAGQKKIEWWEANGTHDFFTTPPVGELFNLSNISKESLQESLNELQEIAQALTLGAWEK